MKFFSLIWIIAIVGTMSGEVQLKPPGADGKLKVVIIRHGEKPTDGDNLCPKGLDRANKLDPVLLKIAGVPDYTYIPEVNTGKTTRSVRMLQTITPFAVAHNLTLNSSFKNDQIKEIAADIMKKEGVVLVVWEHSSIPDLANELGVKGKLKWKDEDYDSIWILEFKGKKFNPEMTIEHQKINPRGNCG